MAKKTKKKVHTAWKIAKNPKKLAELKLVVAEQKKLKKSGDKSKGKPMSMAKIAKKFGMSLSNLYYTLTTGTHAKKVKSAERRRGKIVYKTKATRKKAA